MSTTEAAGRSLAHRYGKRMMVLSGRVHPELATAIAGRLGVELGAVHLQTFADSEVYCRIEESVRGADVFIVQPTCASTDGGLTANDALLELLLLVDAAVSASAHRVIAVTPWFGYSRQDKKSAPREPISARLVARLLEAAGVDRVLTMDLHTGQLQGFFGVPVDHMTAMVMLGRQVEGLDISERPVVVAPEAARAKLSKKFADRIGADFAIFEANDPESPTGTRLVGDVEGRPAIVVDDMIDTGITLRAAGESVREAGATHAYAVASHGLFSNEAYRNLEAVGFDEVIVTDSIPLPAGAPGNLRVCSCDELLADSIKRIFTDDSVSAVFEGQNQVF